MTSSGRNEPKDPAMFIYVAILRWIEHHQAPVGLTEGQLRRQWDDLEAAFSAAAASGNGANRNAKPSPYALMPQSRGLFDSTCCPTNRGKSRPTTACKAKTKARSSALAATRATAATSQALGFHRLRCRAACLPALPTPLARSVTQTKATTVVGRQSSSDTCCRQGHGQGQHSGRAEPGMLPFDQLGQAREKIKEAVASAVLQRDARRATAAVMAWQTMAPDPATHTPQQQQRWRQTFNTYMRVSVAVAKVSRVRQASMSS
eukprot:m.124516 g.124516  ORF g.124516 m.124516 type:complete len:261 (-) comp16622_c0_seq2:96-878(-)